MKKPSDLFRDFGPLPQGQPPPAERIRCFFSTSRIVGQYIGTALVSALGIGLAILLAVKMPWPLNLLGSAASLAGFGMIAYLATHNDYRWVELDGDTLRAKHLYTGRTIERRVNEIEFLGTMVYTVRRAETVIVEALLGVKGVEIRFRDRRTPLRVLRADPAMTNAKEFIEALVFRMAAIREIEPEIIEFARAPLVRNIHWKGETPTTPPGKTLKLCLACVMLMGLLFGTIQGFLGRQEHRRQVLGSVPAREVSLKTLIENGAGTNPHVTLTDFRFGGYVIMDGSAWIALFPADESVLPSDRQREIRAVLHCDKVASDVDLDQFLQRGDVTGICSEAPDSNWGVTVGPRLNKANPGYHLGSAWEIEELANPPTAERVRMIFLGSEGCFALVLIAVVVLFVAT